MAQKDHELMLDAAKSLREISAENQKLQAELDEFRKVASAEKIAENMAQKGILAPDQVKQTALKWVKDNEDLETLEKAAQMAEKLPEKLWSGTASGTPDSGSPESKIENFLMGIK